jgi:Chalcone isomerase-like
MSVKNCLLSLLAMAALTAGTAHGKECQGISFPDQAHSDGTALALNGLGTRMATVFKVKVYIAALYVAKTSADANAILGATAPYELILHFVRDVGAKDINKGWVEGFERNGRAQLPVLQERVTTLTKWMSDLQTGQRLQFLFKPGSGLEVNVNGVIKGTISGDDFGRAFLSIWLGIPPNPEVKSGMLGGVCG